MEEGKKVIAEIMGVKAPVFFTQFQRWPTGELRFVEDWIGMMPEWMKNMRGYQSSHVEYNVDDVLVAHPDGFAPKMDKAWRKREGL